MSSRRKKVWKMKASTNNSSRSNHSISIRSEKSKCVNSALCGIHEVATESNAKYNGNHLSMLSADITSQLISSTYECVICSLSIERTSDIWSCEQCYVLFHYGCIMKWSKHSISVDHAEKYSKFFYSWSCPACRFMQSGKPICRCFCGKQEKPKYNPLITPHSCGELCGKLRKETEKYGVCPHRCSLVCHPGPCENCSAIGPEKTCFCGRLTYRLRCGAKDFGKSCGGICGRLLNCSKHHCTEICHAGECNACTVYSWQHCYCGRKKELRLCDGSPLKSPVCYPEIPDVLVIDQKKLEDGKTESSFSCLSVCDRLLSCGNHRCPDLCHTGACRECPLLPKNCQTCPCGKIPLELLIPYNKRGAREAEISTRSSCLDPLPTCPNICDKELSCHHRCKRKCHCGPCPPCLEYVGLISVTLSISPVFMNIFLFRVVFLVDADFPLVLWHAMSRVLLCKEFSVTKYAKL